MWQNLREFFAKIHKNSGKFANLGRKFVNLGEKFVNLNKIKE